MEEGSRREGMIEFIDASVFLGMHSNDEQVRVTCKNYFVQRLNEEIGMSLEQVGKCDDIIWQLPRERQDAYYPFMDNLHSMMKIDRTPYNEGDVKEATFNQRLYGLDFSDRLTIGMVLARRGVLYTVNPQLVSFKPSMPLDRLGREVAVDTKWFDISDLVRSIQEGKELTLPTELERLYQQSLAVRI